MTCCSRLFQRALHPRAVASRNGQSPSVVHFADSLSSVNVDRERRRWHDSTVDVRWIALPHEHHLRLSLWPRPLALWPQAAALQALPWLPWLCHGNDPLRNFSVGRSTWRHSVNQNTHKTGFTWHWILNATSATAFLTHRPELNCSSPVYWLPAHVSESVRLHVTENATHYVIVCILVTLQNVF